MLATFPSPQELQGTVQGTLLYLSLYTVFLTFQSFSKFYILAQHKKEAKKKGLKVSYRAIKYYNSKDVLALAGDRTLGNFLEQAILFLPLLWMHAVLVDETQSWMICVIYTLFRMIYPIAFMKGGFFVLVSTVPGYLVLIYLFSQVLTKVAMA